MACVVFHKISMVWLGFSAIHPCGTKVVGMYECDKRQDGSTAICLSTQIMNKLLQAYSQEYRLNDLESVVGMHFLGCRQVTTINDHEINISTCM